MLRTAYAINQQTMAAELGITRTYLSKLENQKFSPGPELMASICIYFSKELGEIFYINRDEGGGYRLPEEKELKQYIHTLTVDRKTGEPLSETITPHHEGPEVSETESSLRFFRAMFGDVNRYVDGMHREKGA